MNQIISIKEEITSTLPDGMYLGSWSSNIIKVKYGDRKFILETTLALRSICNVVVTIKNGEITYEELNN